MHISYTALSSTIGRFKTSQYRPISARISWKESKKNVTGYSVRVEGPDSTQVIPRRNTSVEISNLRPSTLYFFKVSAVTVAGTTPQRPYYWKSFFDKDTAQCDVLSKDDTTYGHNILAKMKDKGIIISTHVYTPI